MGKNIFNILLYIVVTPFFVMSGCSAAQQEKNATAYHTDMASENINSRSFSINSNDEISARGERLLRIDPRYISWLEKESLLRHAPSLLQIVSGTSLSWRAPSAVPEKTNILSQSPAWFYVNPWKIKTQDKTHIGEFITSKTSDYLQNMGIKALFFSPSAPFSLNQELTYHHNERDYIVNSSDDYVPEHAPEYAVVGFGVDKQVATAQEYQNLERAGMFLGGSILEPALGVGADFMLALRAVRDYSGLFIMTELPKNLWHHIPYAQEQNAFSYTILKENQKNILAAQGIIPTFFTRDIMNMAVSELSALYNQELMTKPTEKSVYPILKQDTGFAVTNPIRGVDSAERRWIYRYAQNPTRPLLNLSDPNLNAHKLFSASIIQQIGLLHQPLVSVSIGDLWGQEASYITNDAQQEIKQHVTKMSQAEQKLQNTFLAGLAEPALFALAMWNKSIHNYGAWSLIEDAFPMEYIPILLEENSDFVADTIFMPALEKAFLTGSALPLKNSVQKMLSKGIDARFLWHASQDRYQKQVFQDFFEYKTSMELACHVADIDENDAKNIEKYIQIMTQSVLNSSSARGRSEMTSSDLLTYASLPQELARKYEKAQKIQQAFITFQTLLPGLSFLSIYDLHGVVPVKMQKNEEFTSTYQSAMPEFTLAKNSHTIAKNSHTMIEDSIMLRAFMENQNQDTESLLHILTSVYAYKQKERLGEARLVAVLETSNSVFSIFLQAPTGKYFVMYINPTDKREQVKTKIPSNVLSNVNIEIGSVFSSDTAFDTQRTRGKLHFTKAKDAFSSLSCKVRNNQFSFSIAPYECRIFELF